MTLEKFPEIIKLSTKDKILLVENLWDSISPVIKTDPIPESHQEELDNRLKTLNDDNLITLDDLKQRFKK